MNCEQTKDWRRSDGGEGELEMIANALPDGDGVQLLRGLCDPALKQGGDTHQGCPRLFEMGMQAGQRDRRLARMLGPAPDRGHQPWPAGDGLAPRIGMGQAHEQAPPVVDQRHAPGGQLTAMQVVRGKAAPAPLVLEFVEGILAIPSLMPL